MRCAWLSSRLIGIPLTSNEVMCSFWFRPPLFLLLLSSICIAGQTLERRQAEAQAQSQPQSSTSASIPLVLAAGTPIKVAIENDVRVRRIGQPIHGKTV